MRRRGRRAKRKMIIEATLRANVAAPRWQKKRQRGGTPSRVASDTNTHPKKKDKETEHEQFILRPGRDERGAAPRTPPPLFCIALVALSDSRDPPFYRRTVMGRNTSPRLNVPPAAGQCRRQSDKHDSCPCGFYMAAFRATQIR